MGATPSVAAPAAAPAAAAAAAPSPRAAATTAPAAAEPASAPSTSAAAAAGVHAHGRKHAGKVHKGVRYGADGAVADCLFCRIAGGAERNPLWYQDDLVSVFVPREPAAVLHLLVIPNRHVPTLAHLATDDDVALLHHMGRVAREQLAAHHRHFDLHTRRLTRMALPPSHYAFPRGSVATSTPGGSESVTSPATATDASAGAGAGAGAEAGGGTESTPSLTPPPTPSSPPPAPPAPPPLADDANVLLAFHKPPYNSIDHLHLHALYTPFVSLGGHSHFIVGAPWVRTLHDVIAATKSRAAAATATRGTTRP